MAVWVIAPVEDRPEVTLIEWRAFDVLLPGGDGLSRHFVGYALEDSQGQVSSPLQEFSPATRAGRTRSGRTYRLQGRPGADSDAQYVWNRWRSIWGVTDELVREVTREVVRLMEGAGV